MAAVTYDFFAGPLSQVTRTNFVLNPSTEVDMASNTPSGAGSTAVRSSDQAYAGSFSVKWDFPSTLAIPVYIFNAGVFSTRTPVTVGQTYTFSVYLFAAMPASYRVDIRWATAVTGGALVDTVGIASTNTGSTWTRYTVTGVCPVGYTHAQFHVVKSSNTVTGTAYIDAALFEQSATAGTYFDGTNADGWTDYTLLSQAWNGTANNSTSTATWLDTIPAVQNKDTSFSVTKGRQQVQDPFRASTATVTGLDISQVSGLNIGDTFIIRTNTINGAPIVYDVFNGFIADVSLKYDFTTGGDSWTIQAEDALALAGRTVTSQSWAAGDTTYTAATKAAIGSGIYVGNGNINATSTVSAQTLSNSNLLNVINELAATEQARLWATGSSVVFQSRAGQGSGGNLANFSDGTLTVPFPIKYDTITFRSRADSFYTKVITEPVGLAAQTAGTGTRTFTFKTYDETETQSSDLADYVLGTLEVSQGVPSTLSFLMEQGASASAMFLSIFGNSGAYTATVVLRGTQYNLLVEGATISANPSQTRCTLSLSSPDAAVSFILDNAVLGVLDTSKLGF